jgi:transglutaminase-like putative cysteine protease
MNGRARIAFSGAAATMLTALCLWPLVTPAGWLLQAAFLVLVVTGLGLGLRRIPVPRPVVPLLQLVAVLLLLTLFYTSGPAVGGFLPGPGAVRAFNQLISDGIDEMTHYAAPAPARDGLTLILVSGVVLIGLLVDLIAVTYQRVALAGLPLLALYSVGTGLHPKNTVWFWFLLAALGYLALLMAEGRDRLSRWGRVFHGTPAAQAASGGGNPLTGSGYRIAVLAVVAGLLLPLGLPSMDTGLVGRIGGGPGIGGNSIITAVNPLASLAGSLTQRVNTDLLSYTTSAADPSSQYLRIVDLDKFDGTSWSPSSHAVQSVTSPLPATDGLSSTTPAQAVQTQITTVPGYAQQWLPMPYPALSVSVSGDWRYEPEGRTLVGAKGQTASNLKYTVNSLAVEPTADQLRRAGKPPAAISDTYLSLPKNFPTAITTIAQGVTKDATTPYDKAVALQNWFTTSGGFSYNTNVKADSSSNAMLDFLRNKQGYCVHFATTMAAMARALGIPTRVSVGFTPGTRQPDGSWVVGTKDAHAWPELYFDGVGWLRFEPTPGRGAAPDYTAPSTTTTPVNKNAPTDAPGSAATAAPKPSAGCISEVQQRTGGCTNGEGGVDNATGQNAGGPNPLELALIAAGGLLVLLLLTPMLWRLRARNRRLRRAPQRNGTGGGSGVGREELSEQQVLAAWRELIDSAWDIGIPPDEAETPRRIAARIVELGELRDEPRAAAGRLALATEQVLYAPRTDVHPALRQDVRAVRDGLLASVGRTVRIRAVLLPPSSARLRRSIRNGVAGAFRRGSALLRRPFRRFRRDREE